jgi:hypothetical protein
LYIPGGDSVFLLVVFAVYGLGGVFVPLLIIRWLGYKPDSTHSIAMMTAAFSGVLIWTVLGFGDADGVFPSVPGMGAAFITHFSLNYFRTPHLSSLGRFNWPKRSQYRAVAAAIIIPFGAAEAAYLVYAPDSSDHSDGMKTYIAQIDIQSAEPLLLGSGSFDEGQALTFDVIQDSAGVDLKEIKNITGITFMFDFESPSIADQSEPTVSIRITNGSDGNELYTDTQTSFEHEWLYYHEINNLTGNITMSADSEEDFRFQLEIDGEYIFIEVIYEDSNAILPVEDDSLDYDVLIFLETWNIDNITES